MKLTLRYFASLREALGGGGEIDWPVGADASADAGSPAGPAAGATMSASAGIGATAGALRAWLRAQSDAHAQALAPGCAPASRTPACRHLAPRHARRAREGAPHPEEGWRARRRRVRSRR